MFSTSEERTVSFTEFAQNRETPPAVLYKVGESSTEKDWPAYHPGSLDSMVGRSTMQRDWTEVKPAPLPEPFQVHFNLSASPRGTFILHLDAIFRYRHPAPPLYRVVINGSFAASYRLNPHPAPELWWPNGGDAQGNMQYFGYQTLDMQLPASAFAIGMNTLAHSMSGSALVSITTIFHFQIILGVTHQPSPKLRSSLACFLRTIRLAWSNWRECGSAPPNI